MTPNDQEHKPTPEESYDFGGPGGFENPWAERTLGREAFYLGAKKGDKGPDLKKDGEARCFIIRRPQFHNIYGGVQFWLQVAMRDDLSPIGAPFYSAYRLNQGWTYTSKKSGRQVIGYGPKNCPLAALVRKNPHLVMPLKFDGKIQYWPPRNGEPPEMKRDFKKLFAIEIFEVLFEYAEINDPAKPGMKKKVVVLDENKKPKYAINPKPFIWELNEPWWEQLRSKVLAPKYAKVVEQQTADIDGPVAPKVIKNLPTNADGTPVPIPNIVLKLYAKTDPKDPSKATYEVDFSDKMTVDASAITPVDELPTGADGFIDWNQIYPPMTDQDAKDILEKANEFAEAEATAAMPPTPAAGSTGAGAPPPAADDDIPF